MKFRPLIIIVLPCMGNVAQADALGLSLVMEGWVLDSAGSIGNSRQDQQDFNLDQDNKVSFSVALAHPLPLLPNLRVRHSDFFSSGANRIDPQFTFSGATFAVNSLVATDFDFQNTDLTLYYQIFDNDVLAFDLGLTGKYLDGDFRVADEQTALSARASFNGVIPSLYGAVEVGVPATGFSFFGEMNALSVDDNTLKDYQAGVAYSFVDSVAIDLSIRAGYREFTLELYELDDVFADWSFDGPFLGVEAHF